MPHNHPHLASAGPPSPPSPRASSIETRSIRAPAIQAPEIQAPAIQTRRPCAARRATLLVLVALVASTGCRFAANGQNTMGARLYEQGQYSSALQHFQKVIESDPSNADGYYNLAATNHRLGIQRRDGSQLAQAESLYNQCLDFDPNHVDCHRALAVLLVDTGRSDRAFALLKNWAAATPNYAEPRVELARLYEEIKQPETALKYLEDAVVADPNNARAWLALGRIRETAGDLNQALQNYQRSVALGGGDPMVQSHIAALSRQIAANFEQQYAAPGTAIATTPQSGMVRR